jgi:hypothetical protein
VARRGEKENALGGKGDASGGTPDFLLGHAANLLNVLSIPAIPSIGK